ncbi:hypothetical protein KDL01_33485 [Actinospica durhamensis]|uniref:Deacetylase sirtuin-type domain-containing protein n=1 Tax=Actinospica durhamensis TaxID=1508375 RepID=A0A941EXJ7_9ACTN|nr:hypothetical protein [Actinospica durhamensis]MBR7838233.1 hypothetical protein [Actinospica durhamensis]
MNHEPDPAEGFEPDHAVETVARWFDESDHILITAGAGLTAAAGYDYGDEKRFKELFPALHALGLRSRYMVGVPLPAPLLWGYWAVHIHDIRLSTAPNPLYRKLHAAAETKNHSVMTSNVDALFARNGFEPDKVFTPQGDYGLYQCSTPCTRETWDTGPLVDRLLAAYDPETGAITDPDALPTCPNCGGGVQINVRIGREFVDDPYIAAGQSLNRWLAQLPADARLLVLEFGAGFNTPGVIRIPGEHIVRRIPGSRLARVNPVHADVPAALGDRAIRVRAEADRMIEALGQPG